MVVFVSNPHGQRDTRPSRNRAFGHCNAVHIHGCALAGRGTVPIGGKDVADSHQEGEQHNTRDHSTFSYGPSPFSDPPGLVVYIIPQATALVNTPYPVSACFPSGGARLEFQAGAQCRIASPAIAGVADLVHTRPHAIMHRQNCCAAADRHRQGAPNRHLECRGRAERAPIWPGGPGGGHSGCWPPQPTAVGPAIRPECKPPTLGTESGGL